MEKPVLIRHNTFSVTHNGAAARWSGIQVHSSALPVCDLTLQGEVAVGDDISVAVDKQVIFTGTVRSIAHRGGEMYDAHAECDAYKLAVRLSSPQSWRNAQARSIMGDILGDMRHELGEEFSAMVRSLTAPAGMLAEALMLELMRMVQKQEKLSWWFDAKNVLHLNALKRMQTETVDVPEKEVLKRTVAGFGILPRCVLYNQRISIAGGASVPVSGVQYTVQSGGRHGVQVYANAPPPSASREIVSRDAERELASREPIMQRKGYDIQKTAPLVVAALQKSALLLQDVKTAVLKPGAIGAIYAAEAKRWKLNDSLPSIPEPWMRGLLGGLLGGAVGSASGGGVLVWLGIFARSVNIPFALVIGGAAAAGAVAGAIGGAVIKDANATVGRGQMKQATFDDVKINLDADLQIYMSSLVEQGFIQANYHSSQFDDVNLFNRWVQFFTQETRAKFLEDFFVLGALALKVQQAWTRGQTLNAKITDPDKHRTMADAVQFGIAEYHGMRPALVAAQSSAGVYVSADEVTDARYAPLVPHLRADDAAYVQEVYSALQ